MNFWDDVKDWMQKGAEASKSAFEKAGDAVQDFSDKSVIKIEIRKLEGQKEKLYSDLGKKTCEILKSGNDKAVTQSDVIDIMESISVLEDEINLKRKELE